MGCSCTKQVKTKGNQIASGQSNGHVKNGHVKNELVKNGLVKNGLVNNVYVQNGHADSTEVVETTSPPPEKKLRAIRGDLDQRKDAKRHREKKLQERRKTTVKKAMVMSDRIMDERERLSLASSRATSRTGTPATDRRSRTVVPPFDSNSVPPSEADEDTHNDFKRACVGQNDQIRKHSSDTVSSLNQQKQGNDIEQTNASCSSDKCNDRSVEADDSEGATNNNNNKKNKDGSMEADNSEGATNNNNNKKNKDKSVEADDSDGASNNNNKTTNDNENCADDTCDLQENGQNLSGVKLETGDPSENIT